MTDRHPDIDVRSESVPDGLTIIYGARLMLTARAIKCPYGEAYEGTTVFSKRNVVGIVISKDDKARMAEAIKRKGERARIKGRVVATP